MSQATYAAVGDADRDANMAGSTNADSPRLDSPRLDSPRMDSPNPSAHRSVFRENISRPSSPLSPRLGTPQPGSNAPFFSSAQAYAPVENHDYFAQNANTPRSMTPSRFGDDGMSRSGSALPWSPGFGPGHHSIRHSIVSATSFNNNRQDSLGDIHSLYMPTADSASIPLRRYIDAGTPSGTRDTSASYEKSSRSQFSEKFGLKRGEDGKPTRKQWCIFSAIVAALIIIAVAVAVPLVVVHDMQHAGESGGSTSSGSDSKLPTSGGNGSTVTMANGTTFVYTNNYGGYWRSGLADDGARAQSYTPAMNETWDYASNRMLGVNLGGWLVTEPFIVPGLFEPYENDTSKYVVDEYTLMQQWQSESGVDGARQKMLQHYDTFITEQDFAEIAAAGLNWVRLPIGYWAIATEAGEPFLQGDSWTYFLKAVQWARKYGLRINLDLHAIPGSQNGYNHGGRLGVFNFLNSPSGMVSAQRTLEIIRTIAEFISQPEISNVVPVFGILNEPNLPVGIGIDSVRRFYAEVYSIVRNVSGTGSGHGPYISYHDGFLGLSGNAGAQSWNGFMQGGDRVAWDTHPYVCFVPPFPNRQGLITSACNGFMGNTDTGLQQYGLVMAGEWSLATNDCGLFLNGPYQGVRYDGTWASGEYSKYGDCEPFDNYWQFNASTKTDMRNSALAQMDALHNFFFWTWKIGGSVRLNGGSPNPNWSYKLGLDQGWMPTDPNSQAVNACKTLQSSVSGITKTSLDWQSTFASYQTGAANSYSPQSSGANWPPTSIYSSGSSNALAVSTLPAYTQTGAPLIPPTPTLSVSSKGEATPSINPWADLGPSATPAFTAVQGCTYPNSIWANATSPISGWPCTGAQNSKRMFRFGYPLAGQMDGEALNLDAMMQHDDDDDDDAAPVKRAPAMPMPTPLPQLARRR